MNRTSAFLNRANEKITMNAIGNTSNSCSDADPYGTELPSNINVFSNLTEDITRLEDSSVKDQVMKVLFFLYLSLRRAFKQKTLSNYLSRINLIQQEDKAALIEWNFQDFRVGFILERNKSESSYFMVSQDKSTNSFMTDSQKLDTDTSVPVEMIVKYVLDNT